MKPTLSGSNEYKNKTEREFESQVKGRIKITIPMRRKKRRKDKTPEEIQREAIQRIHEKAERNKSRKWFKNAKEVAKAILGLK